MAHILFEVTPLNSGTPITLRIASGTPDPSGVLQNGYAWKPIITARTSKQITLSSDGLLSEIQIDYGSISFHLHSDYGNDVWSSYEWTGALGRIFVGNLGDPFSSYVQTFEGNVASLERDGAVATVALLGSEAALNTPLLTASYAGTGNAEGPSNLLGTLKPRAFGNCQCVDPVLVDPAHWIYQVHGYGSVASITVYEFAQALDPAKKKTDCANYAVLAALTLVPGEWGTCLAEGLFRLGGTPAKKVSADLTFSGTQTVATIIPQILAVAGVSSGKIGSMSIFTGMGWTLYQKEQVTVGEVARSAALQAGGYLFPDGNGTWQVGNYFAPKTAVTVNADRSTTPLIRNVKELTAAAPVWKVKVNHSRNWNVHSASDVSPAIAEISDKQTALTSAADNAQAAADAAAADATYATSRITSIGATNLLDRASKVYVTQLFGRFTAEKAGLNSQALGFTVQLTTENNAYNTAYSALSTYLTGLSPGYTDTTADTTIVNATFVAKFTDYLTARSTLLTAIRNAAKAWSQQTGVPVAITTGVPIAITDNGYLQTRVPSDMLGDISSDNVLRDPLFNDNPTRWTLYTYTAGNTAVQFSTNSTALSALKASKALRIVASQGNAFANSALTPVPVNGTYNATARIYIKAGFIGALQMSCLFFDKAGTQLSQTTMYPVNTSTAVTADYVQDVSAPLAQAPSDATQVMWQLYGACTGADAYLAFPAIQRATTPGITSLGDGTNIVPDADLVDSAATWGMPANWPVVANSTTGEGAGKNKIRLVTALAGEAHTDLIACPPGKTIIHSYYSKLTSGGTDGAYALIGLQFFNAAKSLVSGGQQYNFQYGTATTGHFQFVYVAPANTAFVRYWIYCPGSSGWTTTWEISEPVMRFATVSGDNLVAQDGTTVWNDAVVKTSLGVAYAITNQSYYATGTDFSYMTVATRPANNATVGATWGSNITSQPTNLAGINSTEGTKLSGIQTGADVTANSQHDITAGASTINFNADYTGALLAGQLDQTVSFQRKIGASDVTTSTTWAATGTGGITCSISSSGVLSFTAVSNGTVLVTGTKNSVALAAALVVTKTIGSPPSSGGSGATSAYGTNCTSTNSTSYGTAGSDEFTVMCGTSGQIDLAADVFFMTTTGARTPYGKWQWRVVGGTYADVGTESAAAYANYNPPNKFVDDPASPGEIYVVTSKSALTNGTSYQFRWLWRSNTGTVYINAADAGFSVVQH